MPRVGFEPTISAGERPKTYALDRAATGIGKVLMKRRKGCIQTSYKTLAWDSVLLFLMLMAALMLAVQRQTDRQLFEVETHYLYKWDIFV